MTLHLLSRRWEHDSLGQLMKKLFLLSFALLGIVGFSLSFSHSAVAASCDGTILGIPTWYRGLTEQKDGSCVIAEKVGEEGINEYLTIIILNVSEMLMRLVAIVSFGLILYSGFTYITSAGSAQRVESAKKTLKNAVIGLIIALLATAIINLIFGMVKNG